MSIYSPVCYLDLDSDSTDDSGNGLNGSDTAMSYDGTKATFNGTTSRISVAHVASMDSANVSISMWLAAANFPSSGQAKFILNHESTSPYRGYSAYLQNNGSSPHDGDLLVEAAYNVNTQSDVMYQLPLNTEKHILITYDGTNKKIYVNGSLVTTTAAAGPMAYTSNIDLTIGAADPGVGGNFFSGTIRCLGIWNDVKDATDATSLFNSGTPLKAADLPSPPGRTGSFFFAM